MHDFESYLAASSGTVVTPERLKVLGKQAAAQYVREKTPLNVTIASMVKEAGLSKEQTKRVVEEANNTTFTELFKAGFKGNVEFPLADFDAIAVMGDPMLQKQASGVSRPLPGRKYIPGAEDLSVASVFGHEPGDYYRLIKEASETPVDPGASAIQFQDLRLENTQAKADVRTAVISMEEQLYQLDAHIKEAAAEGYAPDAVGAALEMLGMSSGLQRVVQAEWPELIEFGYLKKYANIGAGPVQAGPLPGLVQSLEMTSQQLMVANQLVQETQMAMDKLLSFLRGLAPPQTAPMPGSEVMPATPPGPEQASGPVGNSHIPGPPREKLPPEAMSTGPSI